MFAWAHAEHGIGMHVYTPAQRDAPTNMINNAICGRRGAQAALRAGPHPLQPRGLRGDRRLRRVKRTRRSGRTTRSGSRRARTSRSSPASATGPRRSSRPRSCSSRSWASCSAAGFVMQAAALQGDFVTPTLMGTGENDAAREQRGARALFRHAGRRRQARRRTTRDHAGLAGRVGAREPWRPPASSSRSGRSSPRRPCASRTRSIARGSASTDLLEDLDARDPQGGQGMTRVPVRLGPHRRPTRPA